MNEFKFSCPHCGQHLAATPDSIGRAFNCPTCQKEFAVPVSPPPHTAPTAVPTPGVPALPPPPAATPPPPPAPAPSGKTSGLAVASLVCGLVPCLGGLPAVICGHLGLSHIKRGHAAKGKGLAMAGLILGYLSIALSLAALVQFGLAGSAAYKVVQEAQRQTQQGQGTQRVPGGPGNSGPVDPAPETTDTSSSEPSLSLEITPNTFFAPKEAYSIQMENSGLDGASWQASGVDPVDFELDSGVLKGQGKLRITAPQKVEISFNVNSSKPFRLRLSGLTQATVQGDGDALDLSKPVPAGKRIIIITGGVSPNAAAPKPSGPRPP
jgi:hypothetical protein